MRLPRIYCRDQPDPAQFCAPLAHDTVAQLAAYCEVNGAIALDVGRGSGCEIADGRRTG
jgi:hypothetical protein